MGQKLCPKLSVDLIIKLLTMPFLVRTIYVISVNLYTILNFEFCTVPNIIIIIIGRVCYANQKIDIFKLTPKLLLCVGVGLIKKTLE